MNKNFEELIDELPDWVKSYKNMRKYFKNFWLKGFDADTRQMVPALEKIEKTATAKTPGDVSDGYHTFNELYYHRMILFVVICNSNKEVAWKSKLHHDGTMYDDYFIVGLKTPEGQYTYHYHVDHWNLFNVLEVKQAPEWDGHKPEDITRLMSLK